MSIPIIWGLSLPIWGGIVLFLLIVFQILNGMRMIKVPLKTHKIFAFIILLFGIFHAILGIGLWFGWFTMG
jgi:hypothetical protein